MADPEPFIVWPAPGLPALVQEEQARLALIVALSDRDAGSVARWAETLAFRETFGEASVPAVVEAVEPVDRDRVEPAARGFAELPSTGGLTLLRVRVRASAPLQADAASPVRLYDLAAGGTVVRARSVAAFGGTRRRLRLAFAGDLHFASFWDEIGEAVDRYAPDLATQMLRPTRLLERFIAEANRLWSRGELDLVVLGGDLVEYVFDQPRGAIAAGSGETNVHRVVRALRDLRVPTVAIPGNHEYRAFPWRPRTYGLASVGIPAARTGSLLKRAGLWDRWPLRLSDFDALRTEDESGEPALAHYLRLLAPGTDFALELHGTRLVFASTGCDLLSRWTTVEGPRRGLLLQSLRHCWLCPDSEGLSDGRVGQIAGSLSSARGAAVFFHAPLLNPPEDAKVEECVGQLDPGSGDDLAGRVAFERRIGRSGMRRGVFFRNPGPLVRALVSAAGPVVTFSGHAHQAGAVEIDRSTFAVRSVPAGPPPAPEQTVTMFTAPAVGQLPHQGNQPPGYLLARFEDGRLDSFQRQTLAEQ